MTWDRARWLAAWGYTDGTPEAEAAWAEKQAFVARDIPHPTVIQDIEPYRSVVTGERIAGRAQHRDHLKRHGLQEVGNERPQPKPVATEPWKPVLRETFNHLRLTGQI